jgi:NhaP-type Na+/H+ or K+/H+ antiporter
MYEELAILAVLIFFYSIVVEKFTTLGLSGPITFVLLGLILGPRFMGWFDGDVSNTQLRVITDLTLALILFIDAANADLGTLRRRIKIPARMLLIGLPGVILLGFIAALWIFDELTVFEAAILATMLAATDAALGKAVITNEQVPIHVREGLNAESGLNDGLCVPVLFLFIALAEGVGTDGTGKQLALTLIAEELGIGMLVGLGLTAIAGWLMKFCHQRQWVTKAWLHIAVVGLAIAAFATAQSLHGSGYIAAFTGGLLFGHLTKEATHELLVAAESDGETLAMITWFVFGAAVIGQTMHLITWEMVGYAVLSLTVIRVLPIFLALTGTGESVSNKLFLGWFGPRGLASIVFAIIVLNSDLVGASFMALVVVCTVFLSLILHGISANPLAAWLAAKENKA